MMNLTSEAHDLDSFIFVMLRERQVEGGGAKAATATSPQELKFQKDKARLVASFLAQSVADLWGRLSACHCEGPR